MRKCSLPKFCLYLITLRLPADEGGLHGGNSNDASMIVVNLHSNGHVTSSTHHSPTPCAFDHGHIPPKRARELGPAGLIVGK